MDGGSRDGYPQRRRFNLTSLNTTWTSLALHVSTDEPATPSRVRNHTNGGRRWSGLLGHWRVLNASPYLASYS